MEQDRLSVSTRELEFKWIHLSFVPTHKSTTKYFLHFRHSFSRCTQKFTQPYAVIIVDKRRERTKESERAQCLTAPETIRRQIKRRRGGAREWGLNAGRHKPCRLLLQCSYLPGRHRHRAIIGDSIRSARLLASARRGGCQLIINRERGTKATLQIYSGPATRHAVIFTACADVRAGTRCFQDYARLMYNVTWQRDVMRRTRCHWQHVALTAAINICNKQPKIITCSPGCLHIRSDLCIGINEG